MKYPAYPHYKDSGVAWLGKIPEGWQMKAIKWESLVQRGASPRPIDDPIYFDDDGEYAWVRISDVTAAGMYLETTEQKLSELGASLSVKLRPGALFLSIAGTVGKPCIAKIKCCIHDGFVYFPRWKGDFRYLFYIFASGEPYKGLGKMGTQLNLNTDTVGSIVIGLPIPDEQTAIADFLDRETGRIDTLVAKKRKLVELLKEKRSALISRTVTRGLPADAAREFGLTTGNASVHEAPATYGRGDFNRPQAEANQFAPTDNTGAPRAFKDSGVEWLGEIPNSWIVTNLGFLCTKIGSGKTPSGGAETYVSEGVMFLRSQNVYDEGLHLDDVVFITEEVDVEMSASRVFSNDVLLNITGASLGRTAIVPEGFPPANVNQHVCIIRLINTISCFYISWVMKSCSIKAQIENAQAGAAREGLNFSQISKIKLALPDIDEQTAIATYLDRETAKIDRLIEKVETAMARLHEYRSALITAAVTGKIDVREAL